jgi:hypothetical protein
MAAVPAGLGWKDAEANGPEIVVMPNIQESAPAQTPRPIVESPELPQMPTTGDQPNLEVARIWPFSVPWAVDRSRLEPKKVVNRYGLDACGTKIVSRAHAKSAGLSVR